MATEGLPDGIYVVVGDTKLLAGLAYDGCDEGVVGLDDSGEEVVGGLVVEGSCEHVPEPTVGGVVLCRGHLHLRPGGVCVCVCVCGGGGGGGGGEGCSDEGGRTVRVRCRVACQSHKD